MFTTKEFKIQFVLNFMVIQLGFNSAEIKQGMYLNEDDDHLFNDFYNIMQKYLMGDITPDEIKHFCNLLLGIYGTQQLPASLRMTAIDTSIPQIERYQRTLVYQILTRNKFLKLSDQSNLLDYILDKKIYKLFNDEQDIVKRVALYNTFENLLKLIGNIFIYMLDPKEFAPALDKFKLLIQTGDYYSEELLKSMNTGSKDKQYIKFVQEIKTTNKLNTSLLPNVPHIEHASKVHENMASLQLTWQMLQLHVGTLGNKVKNSELYGDRPLSDFAKELKKILYAVNIKTRYSDDGIQTPLLVTTTVACRRVKFDATVTFLAPIAKYITADQTSYKIYIMENEANKDDLLKFIASKKESISEVFKWMREEPKNKQYIEFDAYDPLYYTHFSTP